MPPFKHAANWSTVRLWLASDLSRDSARRDRAASLILDGVPAIFINLTDEQLEQLQLRFRSARIVSLGLSGDSVQRTRIDELAPPDPNRAPPPALPPPIPPVQQKENSLDAFVRRCLGTVLDLEQLQTDKGALVVVYPDGSYRQVTINTEADGSHLPKVIERVGTFRNLRRNGSRG